MLNQVMVHTNLATLQVLDIDLTMDIKDFELPQQGDRELMRIFLQCGITGQNLLGMN